MRQEEAGTHRVPASLIFQESGLLSCYRLNEGKAPAVAAIAELHASGDLGEEGKRRLKKILGFVAELDTLVPRRTAAVAA